MHANRTFLSIAALSLCISLTAQTYTLDDCLEMAKENNASIIHGQLEIAKSKEVEDQARTKFFPQVQAGAVSFQMNSPIVEISPNDINNSGIRDMLNLWYMEYGSALGLDKTYGIIQNGTLATVSAIQPVYMGGQIIAGNKLAATARKAAVVQEEITERDIELEVEQTYYMIVALQEKETVVQSALNTLDTLYNTVAAAQKAGVAMNNDMMKVELKRNDLRSQQTQLTNGITLSKKKLCQMTGIGYSEDIIFTDDISEELQSCGEDSPAELKLLDLNIEAAKLQRRMDIGKTLPQVAVGINGSYNNILNESSLNYGAFVTVKIPISDWWSTAHNIREHNYAVRQAELQKQNTAELLELRHEQTQSKISENAMLLSQNRSAIQLAEENYRLALINYNAGYTTMSELLESHTLLQQAYSDYTDTKLKYVISQRQYSHGL